jgi:hypothetical protein
MKGALGTFLGRALLVTALTLPTMALTSTGAHALTSRATPGQSTCDLVMNSSVRIESKIPCVVEIRLNGSVRLNLSTGFRWGTPISMSHSVTVTAVSRNTVGVYSAVLHAASVGRATIHDTGTEACSTGVMCPDLAILWTLKIVVTKTL